MKLKIKTSANECVPRFYLPTTRLFAQHGYECHLFFIAPFALLYNITKNVLLYVWRDLLEFNEEVQYELKLKKKAVKIKNGKRQSRYIEETDGYKVTRTIEEKLYHNTPGYDELKSAHQNGSFVVRENIMYRVTTTLHFKDNYGFGCFFILKDFDGRY